MLCALIFWLPIPLGSYRVWAIMFFGFLVSCTFILHLVNCAYSKQAIFPKKSSWPLFGALLAVICVLAIQLLPTRFQSIDPNQTFIMLLKTITMLQFAWLILFYVNTKNRIKTFIYWLIAAGVCQALYGSYLVLTQAPHSLVFDYPYDSRAMGSFTYQNFLANYLAMCMAMGIGLLVSELKTHNHKQSFKNLIRNFFESILSNKIIIRLCLILIITCLILTKSRMGNVAFFMALGITSLFALFYYKERPYNLKIIIVSFFILDLIIIGSMFGVEEVRERIVNTSFVEETRDEVLVSSISLILDKPFLGSGGGSFYTAYPAYQNELMLGHYDNAHNDYIQFSVELGIPLTIILGLLLFYSLFISCKIMTSSLSKTSKGIAFGGSIAIIMMLIHSSVDYSLQSGANSMTFIAVIALLFVAYELSTNSKVIKNRKYL